MTAMALRSGSPNVRLGLAFAASLALHLALLLSHGPRQTRGVADPPPTPAPLEARLVAPALTTWIDEVAPFFAAPPVSAAVSPGPTLASPRPQPLAGRALDAAIAELTRELFYPPEAIARGLQGRVVLLLTLDASGAVTAVEIASGSGHAVLDAAALEAAARIGALAGGRRQVLLPMEFRLE